ncbi:MAG: ABC transporter substrate-binding protein [Endozoicomonadaceae bacterium]|nr:ABC transporter substrate-binding protein [Endozoicomonadaceae bacterium]
MKIRENVHYILVLLVVVAQVALPVFAIEKRPEMVVDEMTRQVLNVVRDNRETFDKDSQRYYISMGKVLDPVVAFDQVARGVMGKYTHRATSEQLKVFSQAFRISLIEFYGKAVMLLDSSQLKVSRVDVIPETLLNDYNDHKIRSIPVTLKVKADYQEYSLTYSVIKDNDQWKARNITIEGINIGIQFRNQFSSAMQQYKNVGQVIDNWSTIMKNYVKSAVETTSDGYG